MKVSGGLLLRVCGGLLVISSVLSFVQSEDEEWIDPYDMLNYDPASKSMRKPAEVKNFESLHVTKTNKAQEFAVFC